MGSVEISRFSEVLGASAIKPMKTVIGITTISQRLRQRLERWGTGLGLRLFF
ncbi:hypothetical protein SynMVIR181_01842 [Synechococcus sp. MVIR-18-1]|nr:hypothetical protein SynMVIR181_01842 [Synechococcus sp. MVIR-18-1]